MKAIQKLLEQAEKLNNNNKCKDVVDLLSDSILEKHKSAELYTEKARALINLQKPEAGLSLIEKALSINEKYYKIYFVIGKYWHKKQSKKAIENYTKAIELNPFDAYSYNNRGALYFLNNDIEKSMSDYNKAIKLNPTNSYAYINRAINYKTLNENNKAISDYTQAINLDPSGEIFYSRGLLYEVLGQYEKAKNDYTKALELGYNEEYIKNKIDKLRSKLGDLKNITTNDKSTEQKEEVAEYYFLSEIDELDIILKEKDKLKLEANAILQAIEKIRDLSFAKDGDNITHYTKLFVADKLVNDKNAKLRYYNVVYMNDPEEGDVLFDYLKVGTSDDIKKCFDGESKKDNYNIYLGSFLPASIKDPSQNHEDELVMWRTYGKDENLNEAAGCSIVIGCDFFSKENKFMHSSLNVENKKIESIKTSLNSQALYKVIYYDKRQKEFVGDNKTEIKQAVDGVKIAIYDFLNSKDAIAQGQAETEKNKVIDKIIYRLLSEIRYLFKSSDYAFENELRVIQYAVPHTNPETNLVMFDNSSLPERLYIESNEKVNPNIKKIILGPKVPSPQKWVYLKSKLKMYGFHIELLESSIKFQ